jgi:hypothetical protein
MCISIPQYYIETPKQAPNISWTLRDINSWKKVEELNETKGSVYCLYPAIVQRGGENKDQVVLVKPLGIVNLPLAINNSYGAIGVRNRTARSKRVK